MSTDLNHEASVEQSLLSLARILFSGQSTSETLDAVAHLAQQTIPGCDAASVTVAPNGTPLTTASTGELATLIDQQQYDANDGPCLQAMRTQVAVSVDSYNTENRWPTVAAAALEHGARSSLSLPLAASDVPFGALNLYSLTERAFEGAAEVGAIFATQASITLANAVALHRATDLVSNLTVALDRRDIIGQAKGILMVKMDIGSDEAFEVLRRASQRSNRKLHDLATELVEQRSLEGLSGT